MDSTGSVLDIDLDTRAAEMLSAFADVMEATGDDERYPAAVATFRKAGERLTDGIGRVSGARLAALPFKGPHGWDDRQTASFVAAFLGASHTM